MPTTPTTEAVTCPHCGTVGKPGDDHTCTCPFHDDDCTDHISTAHKPKP